MGKVTFKVGDKVRIKKNLVVGNYYNGWRFDAERKEYVGKIVTVGYVSDENFILIGEDGENKVWTEEMIEPYLKETIYNGESYV